ncbi:hypothetical protein ASA1KI_22630 [Opitutales bacterium ASA1]|uniref:DEAD/DEAH box helicase n=1 Tax=Congregicoccus parvus TaxID=3081749 RepID=UPI002B2C6F4B|nr:hypothetical protein ASA1KI_22630 [Opitutales bacterium ASA1]
MERIVYILEPQGTRLACRVRLTRLMKWDAFSTVDCSNLQSLFQARFSAYLRIEDRSILLSLAQLQRRPSDTALLDGEFGREVFDRMLATGRLIFARGRRVRLQSAPDEPVKLGWDERPDRRWKPAVTLRPGAEAFALDPPVYIDPHACVCGTLVHSTPAALLEHWLASPELEESAVAPFCLRLASRFPEATFPTPACVTMDDTAQAKPVALLTILERSTLRRDERRAPWTDLRDRLRLRVRFRYGDGKVAWDSHDSTVAHRRGDKVVRVSRDRDEERRMLDSLRAWGFAEDAPLATDGFFNFDSSYFRLAAARSWRDMLAECFPALDPTRWQVDFARALHIHVVDDRHLRTEALSAGEGAFAFEATMQIGGKSYPILPALHRALRGIGKSRRPADVERWLAEGDFALSEETPAASDATSPAVVLVSLAPELLRRLTLHVHELFDARPFSADGRTRIGKWRLAELTSAELGVRNPDAHLDELASLCRRLAQGIDVAPRRAPIGLGAALRPYQEHGLGWLHALATVAAGGILADDMGLGKTVQVIAHLLDSKLSGGLARGALVVAPTSVIDNWEAELSRFAPSLSVGRYHGADRDQAWTHVDTHDVTITSYALLRLDLDRLASRRWDLVILDEAQFIKNAASRTAAAARSLVAARRLCLSGTPIENRLHDVWSLFEFLMPGFLGDETVFRERTSRLAGDADESESAFAEILRDRLRRRLAPFVLRRRKDEVLRELPPKTEVVHAIAMTPVQARRYADLRTEARHAVREAVKAGGANAARMCILTHLLRLRQVCCDPRLLQSDDTPPTTAADSAKLVALLELIERLRAQGSRTLVFSQFTSMLALVSRALDANDVPHLVLTGETQDRADVVERFQSGEHPLLLVSLRAGGFGLNLTAADSVVHYDPWWNPAVERQATDRSHRLGQTRPVFVYKLIVDDSIESKIQELHRTKTALARDLLSEGDVARLELDETTIEFLLGE